MLFIIGMILMTMPHGFAGEITDAEIKAVLVFKFPAYVKWPDDVLNAETQTFKCCVLGSGPLCHLLRHYEGQELMGKTIHIKQNIETDAFDQCHMMFVGPSEKKNLSDILKAVAGKPILTIGDIENFARQGGMISFIKQNDSVRFEINPKNSKRSGLQINSKLLRLSKIVGDE